MGTAIVICLSLIACAIAPSDEPQELELSSITTTSEQADLLHTTRGRINDGSSEPHYIAKHGLWLDAIHQKAGFIGASNVFLVDAPDIDGAVQETANVFAGGRPAHRIANPREPKAPLGNYWLVVYLGVSGSDGAFTVDKVTVSGNKIRFAYQEHPARNRDIYPYFFGFR